MSERPNRLLLVDDDDDNREVLSELLDFAGFEVMSARDVDSAIRLLNEHDVQLVLSDYRLSRDDSWEEIARLRAAATPAPIGLLTGWQLDRAEVLRRGITFLVQKPCKGDELLALIGAELAGLSVSAENEALVRRYFRALTERDWDGFVALCTDDVVYHLPGEHPRFSKTVRGRAELRKFTEETFAQFPDARFEVTSVVALPNAAVGRFEGQWRGGERSLPGAVVFHFRDGLIREVGVRVRASEIR